MRACNSSLIDYFTLIWFLIEISIWLWIAATSAWSFDVATSNTFTFKSSKSSISNTCLSVNLFFRKLNALCVEDSGILCHSTSTSFFPSSKNQILWFKQEKWNKIFIFAILVKSLHCVFRSALWIYKHILYASLGILELI